MTVEEQFMEMLVAARPLEQAAVIEALRQFVKDYDGKPATPVTPSQAVVACVKSFCDA